MAAIASVSAFLISYHEANELQDNQLRQVAALINRHHFDVTQTDATQAEFLEKVPHTDPESGVIVQTVMSEGAITLSAGPLKLPAYLKDGMQTIDTQGEEWRVLVKKLDSGDRVAIGQRTSIRNEAAHNSEFITLVPILALVPILLIIISIVIHRLFKPLISIVSNIDARSEHDFSEIKLIDLPSEISPFILAINRLLKRTELSVNMQREFVADAAHELRTPLSALSLQAERLQASPNLDEMHHRIAFLKGGIQRMARLLEQLLTLARVETATGTDMKMLSATDCLRTVLEDLMPHIEAKQIDFSFNYSEPVTVFTNELKFKIMLKNILENAIKYTPSGGQIEINIDNHQNEVSIHVDDNGLGISKDERVRVFDKFYRIIGSEETGSGLGLSIVKKIAETVGARIQLQDSPLTNNDAGLRVSITF